MMADVTEDEILEVCSCITNKIIENLKYFLVSINDFEKKFIDSSMKNSNESIIHTKIEEWQKNFMDDARENISKNANYLETIKEETDKLKKLQNNILNEIAINEKEVDSLKGKISNTNRKIENLTDMRDKIQVCKLLTKTSFTYKGSSISGYIASKKIDCFEFDPETTSKDDIINNLYDRLKTASQDKKEQFSKE